MMPALHEFADCALDELREIPVDEPRVFAGNFHLTTEAEIVAYENAGPCSDASREGLVMRIAQAEHPAIIGIGLFSLHFDQAEVAAAIVRQGMCLIADDKPTGFERVFDLGDEINVWDRRPGGCCAWSRNVDDLIAFHGGGPAMLDLKAAVGA